MKKQLVALLALLLSLPAFSQSTSKLDVVSDIRKGNKAYHNEKYSEASISYQRALEKDASSFGASFNLANSFYKQKEYEQAQKLYTSIVPKTDEPAKKASAFYNLGNSFLSEKKYKESIDAYKSALKLRPDDMDAKSNLAYAQKMLKKGQGDGGQNSQQDKNQDKEQNEDQNKEQERNEDQNKEQENDQNKGQNKEQEPNNDQSNKQQEPKMDKQQADRLMEAIQQDDQRTQEKVKREQARAEKRQAVEKNW